MIPTVLAIRFVSVGIPVSLLRLRQTFTPKIVRILTWGGLRGGISVALALGIPKAAGHADERGIILVCTYIVVVFSIVVQGLTLKPVIAKIVGNAGDPPKEDG